MIDEDGVRQLVGDILGYSTATQTEVVVTADESGLTRFANSAIHQNVLESDIQVRVRAVVGKRVGVATSNRLESAALRLTVDRAIGAARRQPEDPESLSLPRPTPTTRLDPCDGATANCTPETRAEAVRAVCRLASDHAVSAAGAFETGATHYAVANSLGVFAYDTRSYASFKTVMMSDSGSGYGARNSIYLGSVDYESAAREAIEGALRSRNSKDLPPGEYVTLLQDYAVAELLFYLAYIGLGALSVQEGRSFMNGKFGKQIVDGRVSIWDDGRDPAGMPRSFDFEGVPKRRVDLIAGGVANAVVYDSYTAGKEKKSSTGHALAAPNPFGPFPLNMCMGGGDESFSSMLASIERGLLVTRFWYVNVLHPTETVLTGMTRDGTYLVESGQIVMPVKSMRFTQSVLEALSAVRTISTERRLNRPEADVAVLAPALLLERFRFTGATA